MRSILGEADINALIHDHVQALDGLCTHFAVDPIHRTSERADGCNWDVSTSGGDPICEDCRTALRDFVASLQRRFNLPARVDVA